MKALTQLISRYRWPLGIAAAALLLYLIARSRPLPVETAAVERGPIEEYVSEEAETQLDVERVLAADRAGTMRRIALEVGDRVEKGQVVASIEDTELELTLGGLRDQLQEIEAQLQGVDVPLPKPSEIEAAEKERLRAEKLVEQLEQEKKAAEAEVRYAEAELRRMQELYRKSSASDRQLDEARLRRDVAAASLQALERQLAAARTGVELAALRKQTLLDSMDDTAHLHKVYAAQRERIRKQLELVGYHSHVVSPIEGVVLEKHLNSRQFVQPGTRLLKVGDMSSIEIRADVLSDEVQRVKVGQKVLLVGDAIPPRAGNSPPVGTVKKVYPSGFTKISALGVRQQRVTVLIQSGNSALGLGPGYELDVKIAVAQKEDAVLVPSDAVFATPTGSAVFVVEGGRAHLREIKTGLKAETQYEVVEGLEPAEVVVRRPPTDLKEGGRVSAQEAVTP